MKEALKQRAVELKLQENIIFLSTVENEVISILKGENLRDRLKKGAYDTALNYIYWNNLLCYYKGKGLLEMR